MVNALRKFVANKPKLKKVLSFIYWKSVEPIISGYVLYMIKYVMLFRKSEVSQLKKLGFSNIHIYLTRSWRRGTESDHAHRRYYKALLNDKVVFVKIAKNDATIENEIFIAEKIGGYDTPFIISPVFWSREFSQNTKLLAIEFIDELRAFEIPENNILFDKYCKDYLFVLDFFKEHNIVHADIHRKNLMIDSNNDIKVLDFGISAIIGSTNGVDYAARPGTYFVKNDNKRIYDDAYSFIAMCKNMKLPKEFESDTYKKICDRIGQVTLEVQI